jgi:hypothetical protein
MGGGERFDDTVRHRVGEFGSGQFQRGWHVERGSVSFIALPGRAERARPGFAEQTQRAMQRLPGGQMGEDVADRFRPCPAAGGEDLRVATLEEQFRGDTDRDRGWDSQRRRAGQRVDHEPDPEHGPGHGCPVTAGGDPGTGLVEAFLQRGSPPRPVT